MSYKRLDAVSYSNLKKEKHIFMVHMNYTYQKANPVVVEISKRIFKKEKLNK